MTDCQFQELISDSLTNSVEKLVRAWIHFKYGLFVESVQLPIAPPWDNTSPASVLYRPMVIRLGNGTICKVRFHLGLETQDFNTLYDFVRRSPRPCLLPPLFACTGSGDWVIVVNSGGGLLQGYKDFDITDLCYIDKDTTSIGVPVHDVRLEYSSWYCIPLGYTPRTTRNFRSRYRDSAIQSDLDAILLDDTYGPDSVLS